MLLEQQTLLVACVLWHHDSSFPSCCDTICHVSTTGDALRKVNKSNSMQPINYFSYSITILKPVKKAGDFLVSRESNGVKREHPLKYGVDDSAKNWRDIK